MKTNQLKPIDLVNLVNELKNIVDNMPSNALLWMRMANAIREEEEKLNKLIHIKIDMCAKFHEVSEIDFQILFSRIRIKVLKELLDDK